MYTMHHTGVIYQREAINTDLYFMSRTRPTSQCFAAYTFVTLHSLVLAFKPSGCIKASFYIPENRPNFPITKVLK